MDKKYSIASDSDVYDMNTGDLQDLPVQQRSEKPFSLLSALGISYGLTACPLAIGTYLSVSIGVGGSPVFFYASVMAVLFDMCICTSLAELSAVFPHSSGQVYWTAQLAPKKYARGLSYLVGWLTAAAYFFWSAGAMLISSQLIFALVEVLHSSFVVLPWHYYIVYLAVGLITLLPNTIFFKYYPAFLRALAPGISLSGFFIMVILLARSFPKQSAKYVFVNIVNETGWVSNGVVFFIGILPGVTVVNGFDSAAHMAEEMPRPERQVPQVMVLSALAGAVTGLPMILAYMFCITNTENLLNPVGGQPVIQLLVDSLRSTPLTVIGTLVFILTFVCAGCVTITTFSRVWWSLAREGALPFSNLWAKISPSSQVPLNSVLFCVTISILIGLLELGSTTALNAILGGAMLCMFTSYTIPIFCSLLSNRSKLAAPHYFNLGKVFGITLNVISVVWASFVSVWLCFPSYLPVSVDTMNWAVVAVAGVVLVCGINWVGHSRKYYTEPTAVTGD